MIIDHDIQQRTKTFFFYKMGEKICFLLLDAIKKGIAEYGLFKKAKRERFYGIPMAPLNIFDYVIEV